MVAALRARKGIKVQYDPIGVGSGVKTEYNRLIDDKLIARTDIDLVPWNAGASVVNPWDRIIPDDEQSLLNRDFFGNMKAQAWWSIRTRFYKTWRAVVHGDVYPADQLISLDGNMVLLHQLMKELAQPTRGESTGLRMIVDKKPDGTRSPNLADAVIQAFFPVPDQGGSPVVGVYSG
jgi:phage terminase large subunit